MSDAPEQPVYDPQTGTAMYFTPAALMIFLGMMDMENPPYGENSD